MNKVELYNKLFERFGEQGQILKASEEVLELATEIIRLANRTCSLEMSKKNITEEMADVEIMMEQVRAILGSTNDEIQKMKSYKLSRTAHMYGLIED